MRGVIGLAALVSGLATTPCGTSAAAPRAAGPTAALAVIPFPGTPDASPSSQVIFSALRPPELRTVTVSGTRSGLHAGRLTALAGGGTAFVPAHRFASGEQVTVTAMLSSPAAGTASGAPGSTELSFSFGVARPLAEFAPRSARASRSNSSRGRSQYFRSVPHLHPTVLTMTHSDPRGGDIFATPVNGWQRGPMIFNGGGQLVWYHRTGRDTAFNFEKQEYLGRPVLTWWQGRVVHGHGAGGQDVIMDNSYRTVAVLHGGFGYSSDLHEFQLAPGGRALVDAYAVVPADLSSVGGPTDGRVLDCIIQELDVRTGRVLWEWHALGHVPLSASYNWVPSDQTPFDFFHLNSIQQLPGHRLIISARNTWSVYMLDQRTGRVIWTLGGKYSNWRMGPGTNFEWQHDARLHRGGTLTVFDDADSPPEESESSAKELNINTNTGLVSLVRTFTHSPPVLAGSQGNAALLRNGDMMVGWGSGDAFSEYSPDGRVILDGHFPLGIASYRSYRYSWSGTPQQPPSLAVAPQADGGVRLYASWDGATDVRRWQVLGGATRHRLTVLAARSRRGFETPMPLHNDLRFFAVRALDRRGRTLGQSLNIVTPSHVAIFGASAFANTSTGLVALPLACFAHGACRLTVRVSAGRSALGPAHPVTVLPGRIVVTAFPLSSSGLRRLTGAAPGRLAAQVAVRRRGGSGSSRRLTLVPYSTSGPSPSHTVAQSSTVQFVGTSEFVSSGGAGAILAACYGSVPCHVSATIMAGGTIIGSSGRRYLGVGEASHLPFRLNSTGRSMLAGAAGNQLGVHVTLTNGASTAAGHVVLSRYS